MKGYVCVHRTLEDRKKFSGQCEALMSALGINLERRVFYMYL